MSWLPAVDGWLVTRRDLALAAMRDAATFTVDDPRFTTAQVVGQSMLSLDGAEHDRHRAPFVAPLRLGEVRRRLADAVQEETTRLVDELAPHGEGELRRGFAGPLAAAAVTHALGLDGAEGRDGARLVRRDRGRRHRPQRGPAGGPGGGARGRAARRGGGARRGWSD